MSKTTRLPSLCLTIGMAFAALPLSLQAAPVSFLNHTIIRHIPAKDVPSLRSAIGEALNNSRDGVSTQWATTSASPARAIQVVLTPLQTTETKSADTCRFLRAEVSRSRQAENWQFWFCKQADGGWKSSGSNLPN